MIRPADQECGSGWFYGERKKYVDMENSAEKADDKKEKVGGVSMTAQRR